MALARTPLGKCSPYALPALAIGANLPDADILVRLWGGPEGYLVHHRGVTHGVLGALVLSLALAAALRALEIRRGRANEGSWRGALAIAGAALASHPLLDLLNVYGLRPWLPFDATWVYGDAVFILDPWLWLFLGSAALLGGPRRRAGDVTWVLVFSLGGLVVTGATLSGLVATGLAVLWGLCALTLLGARLRGPRSGRPGWPVVLGLATSALYLLLLFVLGPLAESSARTFMSDALAPGASWDKVTHMPQALDPLRWEVLFEDEDAVWVQPMHLVTGPGERARFDKLPDDARVQRALQSECADAWRGFVRHPHVALEEREDGALVELMDVRYQREPTPAPESGPRRGGWSSTLLRISPQGVDCEPSE